MKIGLIIINILFIFEVILWADNGDWGEDNINEKDTFKSNTTFEKMKIKNRSKKVYKDKVYKYISGDYKVENNNIELANIYLDDKIKNNNIKINIMAENLKVEGNTYRDSIDIKHNKYKNFVQNDEKWGSSLSQEDIEKDNKEYSELGNNIQSTDSRYHKVPNDDISELETIDLRGKKNIKEVNVYIKDTNIWVE